MPVIDDETKPAGDEAPVGSTTKNLLLIAFVATQQQLPIRGFMSDKVDSRNSFTWNMYSRRYSCRVGYT